MQKEQDLGAGSSFQTLTAQRDLALAELDLVNASTAYQKSKLELQRATGTTLEDNGVRDAERGRWHRALRERSLPRTQSPANSSPQDACLRSAEPPAHGRILAADDQPHILEAIELLLRPAGFEVDTAKIARRLCAKRWPASSTTPCSST